MCFGLLDILTYLFTYKYVFRISPNSIFNVFEIILIISLLTSGIFSILKKKVSLIIYYCQFLLKATFCILTFGFLFVFLGFRFNTLQYHILSIIVFILEILRLIITIRINRNWNNYDANCEGK
jgi:hypothetical protein